MKNDIWKIAFAGLSVLTRLTREWFNTFGANVVS